MKRLTLFGLAVVVTVFGVVGQPTASTAQSQGPPSTSLLPADMMMVKNKFDATMMAVDSDLKSTVFAFSTLLKRVYIKRLSRPDIHSEWNSFDQELSASFWITDLRSVCSSGYDLKALYVLGLRSNGESVVEKWAFSYLSNGLIRMARHELLSSDEWGIIRSIEVDPDERFLLFLTRASGNALPQLYRLDFTSGAVTSELDAQTFPPMVDAKSIQARQHVSEGRQYHLYTHNRWGAYGEVGDHMVFLRDADNDGSFDPPVVVTANGWETAGYGQSASWSSFCP